MIELEHVSHRIGAHDILRDVDLRVEAGEIVALIGPNGAGKSTLLGIASGDFAPTSGRCRFAGRDVATYSELELARERAVVRQAGSLTFGFRVIDVALMGRSPRSHHLDSKEDVAIADGALDRVGLAGLRERLYPTLSGGEQQRVHLARALAQVANGEQGKALLLDEPTAALDPAHQHRVLAIARDIAGRGLAVLAVLHDANLAAQYADRIVVLSRGAVVAQGTPSEVLTRELFEEVFGVTAHVARTPWNEAIPWVATSGPREP